jgi:YD repeat-containing protein
MPFEKGSEQSVISWGYPMPSSAYIPRSGQPTKICPCGAVVPINDSCPCDQTNSPVLLDSGLLTLNIPLMSGAAVGTGGFNFALNYYPDTSTTSSDSTVGVGFNFTQNIVIVPASGYNVYLQSGENTQELFTSSDGITYSSTANNTAAILMRSGAGTSADQFTMVSRAGVTSQFWGLFSTISTPGRLRSYADRYGNTQTLNWGVMGSPAVVRLMSVIDSYGRETSFVYYGPSLNHALQSVTDWLGRQTSLQFDTLGHLTAVVLPSVTRGANNNANTFPNGTAYCFLWDVSNPRPERQSDCIAVYYPNQVAPYLNSTRTVDVAAVYAGATARQQIAYYQDPTDEFQYGKVQQVIESASGSGTVGAGAYGYMYVNTGLPANLIDPADVVVSETVTTDRAGNQVVYDVNSAGMIVRKLVYATRGKNSLQASSWTTWLKYNAHNQDVLTVTAEGSSIIKCYEDETNTITFGGVPYSRRIGLLKSVTRLPGITIGIPSRPGSNGQTQLTELYFHEPIFNQICCTIEVRGCPIDSSGDYFPPQNGGAPPTPADQSRYATITFFDYQKDAEATVQNDAAVQALCFPGLDSGDAYTQVGELFTFVNGQLTATDGTGGIPAGLGSGLGDINGQGTGVGTGVDATHIGNVVKIQHPSVRQLIPNVAPAYAETVLLDAPAAYYRLGEPTGAATAADASGNGNAATYTGASTLGEPGAIANDPNTGVGFNNAGAAQAPYSPSIDLAGNHTIECWAKWTEAGSDQFIVDKLRGDDGMAQYYLWWSPSSGGSLVFGWFDPGAGVYRDHLASFAPTVGQWYHLAVTSDGSTVRFYVNGSLFASVAQVAAATSSGGGTLYLSGPVAPFSGELDEIAIYPTALSAERILAHYNAGTGADQWVWAEQQRIELFTSNLLGQNTTRTDAEGNVYVTVRFPQSDPEGAAQYLVPGLSNKQYGYVKEIHVDADPATVMTLLGPDADLVAFTGGIITRTNSPGVYLDLVTRYQPSGTGASGCASCAYDPLGNPLSVTDPRNNTTTYDRNELGEAYRTTAPAPYNFPVETYFDANRNVIQVDTQDFVVQYASNDPGDPAYAKFVPSGSGSTANLPMVPGPGGAVRPGWFSDLFSYDLLDNKIQQDIDCTGSAVSTVEDAAASLITGFTFDFNQNLVKTTKPLGNTVEQDYDERN